MNSNLIEYLKHNYPYIITNKNFFYIIENDKIIGVFNGKEIIKLSNKKYIHLPKNKKITSLPILKFDDITYLAKINNFNYLQKVKENKLIKDIKKILKTPNNYDYDYDAFYNSENNTFIYIKKEYQKYINEIIKNMHNDQLLIEICKKEIMYNMDNILKKINDYINNVSNHFVHLIDPNMKNTKIFYKQNKKHCDFLLKNLDLLEKNEQVPLPYESKVPLPMTSIDSKIPLPMTSIDSKVPYESDTLSSIKTKEPNLLLDNISILKDEIQKLKDLYNKDNLYIILQNSYKKRCKKYILNHTDDIIYSIKDYYNKWLNWCELENSLNKNDIYSCKKELIKNINILQNLLKNMIGSESNKTNKNIVYIDSMLKQLLNDQLIYLSLKDDFTQDVTKSTIVESNFFDDSEKNIKYRLKKISELLVLNNNTSINTESNNKSEQIFHFITLNNIFFRKQRVITELNDVIQNENLVIQDYILNEFYKIKKDFDKHVNFLNLQEIINSPFLQYHKTNSSIERIPETFYNSITNILDFWNFNEIYYRNQDLDILNVIDDLIDDVNIYIRVKPLVGINDKTLLISTKSTENSISLNGKTYNGFENVFPDDFTNLDVYIGKQDFENEYLLNNVNFLEKFNTVPNGLYNAFNKLQTGYSLFLYGNGISGSGTSYTFFGENGTPGIVQYGLANLENVSNIKLKHLFEQYVSNANDKYVKGNIHNLINIVPELNEYFSIDETTQFSEIIPSYIDVKSLDIKDLQDLCQIIDTHRTKMNRIKILPTGKSSRSSLYYIFQIESVNAERSYLTIVDSCSQDSPNDIYESFIKDMHLENLMICDKEEAISFIQNHAKNNIRNDYSPEFIYKCIQESIYNNEALNHFNYYMNSKNNYYDNVKYHNFDEKDYNKSMYFVNPKSEIHTINRNNNCLTIPIMKFIENISLKKDINRIKYHLIYNIRKELSSLSQTMHTLYLSQDINNKKLYGSIQKLEKQSDYLGTFNDDVVRQQGTFNDDVVRQQGTFTDASFKEEENQHTFTDDVDRRQGINNKVYTFNDAVDRRQGSNGKETIKIIIEKEI